MASDANAKMSAYRRRLRERGLRPVQIWVPDMRDPARRAQLRRDLEILKNHSSNVDGNTFLDAALAEIEGWKA